jgi:hypothetical protein
MDRRGFFGFGFGAVAVSFVQTNTASARAAESSAKSAEVLIALARKVLDANKTRIRHHDVVALADFSEPSWRRRFHLIDMARGDIVSFLVAHGRGSDPRHSGRLERFSDAPGSNATSAGAYRTGEIYFGKHGKSLRLAGLDTQNANAEARAIVVHAAWYVEEAMLERFGKLGRSEGCFAFSEKDLETVLARLGAGRLIYAGKF